MATSTPATKMKLKAGFQAAIAAAPEGYLKELTPLPPGVTVSADLKGKYDWIQVFVKSKVELEKLAP
jgi:hypothetical protein